MSNQKFLFIVSDRVAVACPVSFPPQLRLKKDFQPHNLMDYEPFAREKENGQNCPQKDHDKDRQEWVQISKEGLE